MLIQYHRSYGHACDNPVLTVCKNTLASFKPFGWSLRKKALDQCMVDSVHISCELYRMRRLCILFMKEFCDTASHDQSFSPTVYILLSLDLCSYPLKPCVNMHIIPSTPNSPQTKVPFLYLTTLFAFDEIMKIRVLRCSCTSPTTTHVFIFPCQRTALLFIILK